LTLGPRVAEVAEQIGLPLMPWQRYVVDVALEIDPDTGLLAYREIILTVPRQSGKSTLILAVGGHRSLGFGPRQTIRYGAQTRNDARQKWEDDYVEILEASPLKRLFRVRKTNGNEAIMWNNRSRWGITSNTEKAGHGGTLDLAFLDEAFSQVDNRLEQAFKPAMVTRDNAQFWVVSTAGNDQSVYLKGKRDRGRKLVESGVTKGVAYFEWSAPDDAEPGDREVWRACMPGLRCNGGIIKEDAVEADFRTMDLIEFQRAYLNQWPDRNAVEPVIPPSKWAPLADVGSQVEDPVVFAVDANPERSAAAIAVAGRRSDGLGHIEVVDAREGTGWLLNRIVRLNERHKPKAWIVDPASSAGSLLPALQAAGITPELVSGREMTQACGAFYEDAVEKAAFRHLDQPSLNSALRGARKRDLSDAWAWHRRNSSIDISPLVAATLAWHGFARFGSQEEVVPWAAWV
jgi:phage terminase large subunit-like protein